MKILLINHFPLEGSGSGTYTRDVAHFLVGCGHEVCIVFPENIVPAAMEGVQLRPVYFSADASGATDAASAADVAAAPNGTAADSAATGTDQSTDMNVDAGQSIDEPLPFNFPCFTTHPRSITAFEDLSSAQMSMYFAAFERTLSKVVEEFRPHIIHSGHIGFLSKLGAQLEIPCVITCHGTDLMGYEKWPQFRQFADDAARDCSTIVCISKDNLKATLEVFPQAKDKVVLLPNGYNNEIFYPEVVGIKDLLKTYGIEYHGEKVVLFAGKLTNFKGVDVLLHAAKRYEEQGPGNYMTVLAGYGQEDGNLHALKDSLQLQNAHFIGHQDQAQLRKLYSAADLFVMPSRYEPFGLVALEAMACGLTVVASNVGGLPDFVTPEVGKLTPPLDSEALSDAIVEQLQAIEHGNGRRAKVAKYAFEGYSMVQYARELESIYQKALGS